MIFAIQSPGRSAGDRPQFRSTNDVHDLYNGISREAGRRPPEIQAHKTVCVFFAINIFREVARRPPGI